MLTKNEPLFLTEADLYINFVTCKGGNSPTTKLFKEKFPENHKEYNKVIKEEIFVPGETFSFQDDSGAIISNVFYKRHWKNAPFSGALMLALSNLANDILRSKDFFLNVKTIAIPNISGEYDETAADEVAECFTYFEQLLSKENIEVILINYFRW